MSGPMVSAMQDVAAINGEGRAPGSGGAATARQRLGRDEVLAMGRAGRPWAFLPLALQALHQHPEDAAMRMLTAANWARLRLAAPAAEALTGLPGELMQLPEVKALAGAIAGMERGEIAARERIETCRRNLEALGERGPGVGAAFEAWAREARGSEYHRAADGNVIWRRRGESVDATGAGAGPWAGVSDQVALAARMDEQLAADAKAVDRPVIVEGADPPWLWSRVLRRQSARKDSHRPRVMLVQAGLAEFFDGLSLQDMAESLRAGHVRAIVGPGAAARLADDLRGRMDYSIAGPVMSLPVVRERMTPSPVEVADAVGAEQEDLTRELTERVQRKYAGRDAAWWARRYEEAMGAGPGGERGLRVLVPTARNSTFVKHASADLVEALRSAGHRAELMIEPDDSTRFAAPAYWRRFAEFEPDLVVLINYPRAMLAGAIPAEVPHVCWIQDAMPHLFRREMGAAQGPLDFVIGHLFDELFSKHGYPRERAMAAEIPASEGKFHAAAIHASDRARYECEIAYVSHQSETPAAQHARLRAEFAQKTGAGSVLDRLRPRIEEIVRMPAGGSVVLSAHALAAEAYREEHGQEAAPQLLDVLARAYVQPYADRVIRHDTLGWAAEAAERRGWRFKIFGRGWDGHARLAGYAAGELPHGEALRWSYQAASVHLHMTAHSLVHQRLVECVMSGGSPLCRLHASELAEILRWMTGRAVREGVTPRVGARGAAHFTLAWDETPSMRRLERALRDLGLRDRMVRAVDDPTPGLWVYRSDFQTASAEPSPYCAYWAMGERAEFFFDDAASLEARVAAAVERPRERLEAIGAARASIGRNGSYAGLVQRMLGFVHERLKERAGPAGASGEAPPGGAGDQQESAQDPRRD